jgi:hypothetical protein
VKRIDVFLIIILIAAYIILLFIKAPLVFSYEFDESLVEKYKRSQDITYGVEDRVHISDNDIYIASGYLYAQGENPTRYNFQHPPLIKYLYGISIKAVNNPYWVQLVFGVALIGLTYFLGIKLFKEGSVSIVASIFLIFDPSFFEVSSQALLDLGQAVFALAYFILVIFYPKKYKLQGLSLGLFLASKFWTAAIVFVLVLYGYKYLLKERVETMKVLYSFATAAVVFAAFYFKAYIDYGRYFDIVFFEAKVIKFMLQHNSSEVFGGSVILFITGYFSSWWGSGMTKSSVWSIFWPISFSISLIKSIRKRLSYEHLIYVFPIVYLLLLSRQVPFTRYFVIILPYFYLGLSKSLYDVSLRIKKGGDYGKISRS